MPYLKDIAGKMRAQTPPAVPTRPAPPPRPTNVGQTIRSAVEQARTAAQATRPASGLGRGLGLAIRTAVRGAQAARRPGGRGIVPQPAKTPPVRPPLTKDSPIEDFPSPRIGLPRQPGYNPPNFGGFRRPPTRL